jgi:putative salt-induced outer membrane protein YdiY
MMDSASGSPTIPVKPKLPSVPGSMLESTPLGRLLAASVVTSLLGSCHVRPEPFDLNSAKPVAQDPKKKKPVTTPDPKAFEPDAKKFDWIRLKSHEWLKGEILGLRDDKFDFDSDELDELEFDWDDVAEVRSSKSHTLLLTDRKSYTGKVRIDDGKLLFLGPTVREVDRSRLLAMVPGEPTFTNLWSGKITLGLTARGGNTEQTDLNFHTFVRRESALTRWDTTYNHDLSEADDSETANSLRAETQFDVFLTRRIYVTVPGATYERDRFQNIDHRWAGRIGIGYDILDNKRVSWEFSLAPGYQETRFVSVTPPQNQTEGTAVLVVGTNIEWDITKDVEFDFEYSLTAPFPDTEKYNHHVMGKWSLDLTSDLELDISFIWDRNNDQIQDANGNLPNADDYRIVVGFGLEF